MGTNTVENAVDIIVFHDELTRVSVLTSGGAFAGLIGVISQVILDSFIFSSNVITLPEEDAMVDNGFRYQLVRISPTTRECTLSEVVGDFHYTRNLCLVDTISRHRIYINTLVTEAKVDKGALVESIKAQLA